VETTEPSLSTSTVFYRALYGAPKKIAQRGGILRFAQNGDQRPLIQNKNLTEILRANLALRMTLLAFFPKPLRDFTNEELRCPWFVSVRADTRSVNVKCMSERIDN